MIQSKGILAISPVRHSTRRYSSIIKNRDLLHKYLVVRHHYAYARQTQVNWKKEKKRTYREGRKEVLYSDSRSPYVKPKQALIALICCGQYIYGC